MNCKNRKKIWILYMYHRRISVAEMNTMWVRRNDNERTAIKTVQDGTSFVWTFRSLSTQIENKCDITLSLEFTIYFKNQIVAPTLYFYYTIDNVCHHTNKQTFNLSQVRLMQFILHGYWQFFSIGLSKFWKVDCINYSIL